jgi:hypothetical protein
MRIFDISGKLIQTISSNLPKQTIDISHLSNGTYIIQLADLVFKKFVVCRH